MRLPSSKRAGCGWWTSARRLPPGTSAKVRSSSTFATSLPWNQARWHVERGTAERTAAEPDLRLHVSDLGWVYLGGFTFDQLRRAERLEEVKPGSATRADALFRTSVTVVPRALLIQRGSAFRNPVLPSANGFDPVQAATAERRAGSAAPSLVRRVSSGLRVRGPNEKDSPPLPGRQPPLSIVIVTRCAPAARSIVPRAVNRPGQFSSMRFAPT